MAVSNARVCKLLGQQQLSFSFFAEANIWKVAFIDVGTITISLSEEGDQLLLRSDVLADLRHVSDAVRYRTLGALMQANKRIALGRYAGSQHVAAEVALPIFDGRLTSDQLEHSIKVVCWLVKKFREELSIDRGAAVADIIKKLRRRGMSGFSDN
ncbi:hypothetical protein [Adhaeretor mobilis]|uniref:Uncharacterized protein n=1 Tax=Adhaeretor mobilis TaxID=1930276 RepID=A0A517MQP7_9BACT|nr:hypothetical protein [Adhaeretor mobilis]QDS97210.1 hypothetical protein HG15A2_04700 [Adhaeretor mobilis]